MIFQQEHYELTIKHGDLTMNIGELSNKKRWYTGDIQCFYGCKKHLKWWFITNNHWDIYIYMIGSKDSSNRLQFAMESGHVQNR